VDHFIRNISQCTSDLHKQPALEISDKTLQSYRQVKTKPHNIKC